MKAIKKILQNLFDLMVYSLLFFVIIALTFPAVPMMECVGYALILGFFAGIINNIERVLRELFEKRKEEKE